MANPESEPYDALLLVSFGGPEKPEDVVPFLENVTRGRGIPRERLERVGEHYLLFGGRSPINDQNKALIAAIEADFTANGIDLPVYWGNRNWEPYLTDTVARMAADGVRRAVCLATSAYSSWSSCRQYLDNLAAAHDAVPGGHLAPQLDKIRPYFSHPGFVGAVADRTVEALSDLPPELGEVARIVFVTHSIPTGMNADSGLEGGAYLRQHQEVAALVAEGVRDATGRTHDHELVFCSRSGSPHTPWLEPDVNDRLEELKKEGVEAVVLVPVGFVSDHMEVVYDLDTEALATCERLDLPARRAGTPGTHPRFVEAIRDLVLDGPVGCAAGCCLPKTASPA